MKEIKYDLVLIGATGFTGKLVAEYLTKEYGTNNEKFVWAIAGRNNNKLNNLKKRLSEFDSEITFSPLHHEFGEISQNNLAPTCDVRFQRYLVFTK